MTITLITGANKGIGHETAKQLLERGHTVYLGARDTARGEAAAQAIGARFVQLDVTDDESVRRALATIDEQEGRLDVLVHNAGMLGTGEVDGPTALRVFDTNTVGIVRVTEAALPLLRRSERPRVLALTSSLGSFWAVTTPERPEYGLHMAPLYAASKAAATMLMVQYAKSQPGIRFSAIEPGTTATDMTASLGIGRSVQETARFVARRAADESEGASGTFEDENGTLAW